ncbi:MAG TPA: DNA-directed RNA polymerase subunit H [Candidatus Nanoarchaeia archaeon]|nr:DNA-directed RNA polymerase subunit H [Candidatus Nanoarchaeia archaeon]
MKEKINHLLVPKHIKLSDSEKEHFLKSKGIQVASLPKILTTDQAIVSLGAKVGDVIKIERASKTAGLSLYYRYVIEE